MFCHGMKRRNEHSDHHGPSCYPRLCLFIAMLVLSLLFAPPAVFSAPQAQWNDPHDYYRARQENTYKLLLNVEKYHMSQGVDKLRAGRMRYAYGDFDFILRYYPNHPRALLLMGNLSLITHNPEQADRYFKKALSLFPDHAETYAIYGIFLQKQGKLKQAIMQYQRALKMNPDSSETHYNLGLAFFQLKDFQSAKAHAETAYRLGFPLPGLRNKLISAGIWKAPKKTSSK